MRGKRAGGDPRGIRAGDEHRAFAGAVRGRGADGELRRVGAEASGDQQARREPEGGVHAGAGDGDAGAAGSGVHGIHGREPPDDHGREDLRRALPGEVRRAGEGADRRPEDGAGHEPRLHAGTGARGLRHGVGLAAADGNIPATVRGEPGREAAVLSGGDHERDAVRHRGDPGGTGADGRGDGMAGDGPSALRGHQGRHHRAGAVRALRVLPGDEGAGRAADAGRIRGGIRR